MHLLVNEQYIDSIMHGAMIKKIGLVVQDRIIEHQKAVNDV